MGYYDLQKWNISLTERTGRLKSYDGPTPLLDSYSQTTKSFTIKEITGFIKYADLVQQSEKAFLLISHIPVGYSINMQREQA
jgi:hypothetical protein